MIKTLKVYNNGKVIKIHINAEAGSTEIWNLPNIVLGNSKSIDAEMT